MGYRTIVILEVSTRDIAFVGYLSVKFATRAIAVRPRRIGEISSTLWFEF